MLRIDWIVFALLSFEATSFLFSQYCANSAPTFEVISVAILAYFAIRLTVTTRLRPWLVGVVGLGGSWLAIATIVQFANGTEPLDAIGLTDLVAFRSRLIHTVRGWVPGEGLTVFLLALPCACAAAAHLWRLNKNRQAAFALLPALPIVAALTLSLSRAILWSTIVFCFVACGLMIMYRVISLRTGSLLLAGALATVFVVVVCERPLYPGIFKGYTGGHSSQVRSTQGRLSVWKRSLELGRGHRLWGVGWANTALFLNSTPELEETTGFAGRAFSLPIQVLVEKGVFGFVMYTAFLLLVALEFHGGMGSQRAEPDEQPDSQTRMRGRRSGKRNGERLQLQKEAAHRAIKCCFAAGLVAVLFRELTYSSLFEHTLTLALAFTLAAMVCERPSLTA